MSDLMMTRFTQARRQGSRVAMDRPVAALRLALRTWLTRQALPELTARELADIGMTQTTALTEAARLPWDSAPGPRRRIPGGVLGQVQQALERARTRRLLARMQAREWSDLGISRSVAQAEADKPMWRG